jgi:FkbM family methyltransferase
MKKVIILLIKKIKSFFPNKLKTQIKKMKRFNGNGLDNKMLNYINYKNGFFIECGANDGVNQSVTWYFERALKWRGLLIEPIKEIFEELKKNRSKNNFFYNTALGSYKCKKKLNLHIDENDSLTTRSTLDNKNRKKISVSCDNLTNILDKIKAPKIIDFFILDVEGDELKILDGIDFKKYKFKFLLIESGNLSKLNQILKKNKYIFIKKLYKGSVYNDYLFKLKNNKELII